MIRPASAQDIDAIAEILVAAWPWAYRGIVPPELMARNTDLPARTERLRQGFSSPGHYLVCERDRKVVGFAREHVPPSIEGIEAEVGALYVHPDAARKGVGVHLMQAMVKSFLDESKTSMVIHTLADNRIGRGFYEKIGGVFHSHSEWNGIPSLRYLWDEAAIRRIGEANEAG